MLHSGKLLRKASETVGGFNAAFLPEGVGVAGLGGRTEQAAEHAVPGERRIVVEGGRPHLALPVHAGLEAGLGIGFFDEGGQLQR